MPLPPRLQWKLRRYRNTVEEWKERFRDTWRGTMAKQKVCPACRALVSAKDSRCPFCNESLSLFDRVGVRRIGVAADLTYTKLLMALNFFMFAISLVAASKSGEQWSGMLGGLPGAVLIDLGSNLGFAVYLGQYWRLLTGALLHANLIHLLFNMAALYNVGPTVEELYGPSRFITLYVWAALCGSLASYWWGIHFQHTPYRNMVGASGAIFGLIGVMTTYGLRRHSTWAAQLRSSYLRWAIYSLAFGLMMPAMDNAAHLGGMAGGALFGYLVSDMPPVTRGAILLWRFLNHAAWLLMALCLFLVGLSYYFTHR
jgi:membrane associated rhomboid family serine protease